MTARTFPPLHHSTSRLFSAPSRQSFTPRPACDTTARECTPTVWLRDRKEGRKEWARAWARACGWPCARRARACPPSPPPRLPVRSLVVHFHVVRVGLEDDHPLQHGG